MAIEEMNPQSQNKRARNDTNEVFANIELIKQAKNTLTAIEATPERSRARAAPSTTSDRLWDSRLAPFIHQFGANDVVEYGPPTYAGGNVMVYQINPAQRFPVP